MFAVPMYTHNIEGSEQVGTSIGCICTLLLLSIVMTFASSKGLILIKKTQPEIATVLDIMAITHENKLKLQDEKLGFEMAFGLVNKKGKPLKDP